MSFGPDPNPTEDKGKACDCLGAGFGSVPLSPLGEQRTNKARRGLGHGKLVPGGPSHLRNREAKRNIWAFLKTSVRSPPGRRRASGTARGHIQRPSLLDGGAPLGSWHPDFSARGRYQPYETFRARPTSRLKLCKSAASQTKSTFSYKTPLVWIFQHWAHPCVSKDTSVPISSLYSKRDQELHLQTLSHLKSTKPFVLSTIKQQFEFFLGKRQPAELKNGLTLFHSTSAGSTTFLLIYYKKKRKKKAEKINC